MRANGRPAGRTFFETAPDLVSNPSADADGSRCWRRTHAQSFHWPDAVQRPGHPRRRLRRRRVTQPVGLVGRRRRVGSGRRPRRRRRSRVVVGRLSRRSRSASSPTSDSSRTSRSTSPRTRAPRPRPRSPAATHDVIVTQAISDYAGEHPDADRRRLRRHRHRRLPHRDRHRQGRQGQPGHQVRRCRPGRLRRRDRRSGSHVRLRGRRRHAAAELPGHRLRRGPARLPRRHRRREHLQVGHDRRRRRHERPGRRQLLARLRERRQVGQGGHQGPLPGDRSEPGRRLQRPGQGQDDRRSVHRPEAPTSSSRSPA